MAVKDDDDSRPQQGSEGSDPCMQGKVISFHRTTHKKSSQAKRKTRTKEEGAKEKKTNWGKLI